MPRRVLATMAAKRCMWAGVKPRWVTQVLPKRRAEGWMALVSPAMVFLLQVMPSKSKMREAISPVSGRPLGVFILRRSTRHMWVLVPP